MLAVGSTSNVLFNGLRHTPSHRGITHRSRRRFEIIDLLHYGERGNRCGQNQRNRIQNRTEARKLTVLWDSWLTYRSPTWNMTAGKDLVETFDGLGNSLSILHKCLTWWLVALVFAGPLSNCLHHYSCHTHSRSELEFASQLASRCACSHRSDVSPSQPHKAKHSELLLGESHDSCLQCDQLAQPVLYRIFYLASTSEALIEDSPRSAKRSASLTTPFTPWSLRGPPAEVSPLRS